MGMGILVKFNLINFPNFIINVMNPKYPKFNIRVPDGILFYNNIKKFGLHVVKHLALTNAICRFVTYTSNSYSGVDV